MTRFLWELMQLKWAMYLIALVAVEIFRVSDYVASSVQSRCPLPKADVRVATTLVMYPSKC